MARYEITSPDGARYEINAPDDATEDDVIAYAQSQFSAKAPEPVAETLATPAPEKDQSFTDSVLLGLKKRGAGLIELGLNTAENFGADVGNAKQALADVQQNYAEQGTGTGIKGLAGEILGDPLTYIPGVGATKGAATLGKVGLGTGLLAGVTTGTGDAESTLKDNAINAGTQGALGVLIGGALGKIGSTTKSVSTGVKARGIEELEAAGKEIRKASNAAYKEMRNIGAVVKPSSAKTMFGNIGNALGNTSKLNQRLHGDTISVLKDMKAAVKRQSGLGLEDIDQFRQQLNDVVSRNTDIKGKMNGDAFKANKVIHELDAFVEKIGQSDLVNGTPDAMKALNLGRSEWARYSKHARITNILKKADGDPNRIKAGIKQFINNDKNLRGFTKQEVAALKIASRQSAGEGALKALGKFGFDFGNSTTFGNTALPAGAIALGNPALAVAGTVARQGQKYLARSAGENVIRAIEGSLPQAQNTVLKAIAGEGVGAAISGMGNSVAGALESRPLQAVTQPMSTTMTLPQDELSGLPHDIRQDEGLRHQSYDDTTGHRTVGYGFNMDSGIGRKVWKRAGINVPFDDVYEGKAAITDAHAEALGRESFKIAVDDAVDLYSNFPKLSDSRKEALFNLSYQMGKTNLSKFKEFNAAVNKGNWTDAVRYLMKTKAAQQAPQRFRDNARKLLRG